eukprot:Skav235761  [mRNA]  locus=scaffold803:461046:465992:+ [translate_table: standard]
MRIGEAAHPGPWKLSAVNPTGVNSKSAELKELMPGICSISETHLTQVGAQRFRRELAFEGQKVYFSASEFVEPRSRSKWGTGGVQSGVGFLASNLIRKVPGRFDESLQAGTRMHAAHFWTGATWITGGVMYGVSMHSEKPEVREITNKMLVEVADKVLPYPGPKFLAGDWNQVPGKLAFVAELESRGWKEVQDVAKHKWGQAIVPTCKLATRKDYLMLCPEMQQLVERVQVVNYTFADHAILLADMKDVKKPEAVPRWRRPQPIDMDKDEVAAFIAMHSSGEHDQRSHGLEGGGPCQMTSGVRTLKGNDYRDQCSPPGWSAPTHAYRQLWQDHESDVTVFLQQKGKIGLLPRQRGRASTMQRSELVQEVHAIKGSRVGEPQLEHVCLSRQLKQWFTQLRRLVNMQRLCKEGLTVSGQVHKKALWRAIVKANGFFPSFPRWWMQRSIIQPTDPTYVPSHEPSLDEVAAIAKSVEMHVRELEKQQHAALRKHMKMKYQRNQNNVFKDVKEERPAPVESLLETMSCTVVEVVDEGSVVVDSMANIKPDDPLFGDELPLYIEVMHDDQLWFKDPHALSVGQKLTQHEQIASLTKMFDMFGTEWRKRWDRHRGILEEHWSELIDFAKAALHPQPMQIQQLEAETWKANVKAKPQKAATGMDGVSRQDLLRLSPPHVDRLLAMLGDVESSGHWPEQIYHGAVHSLRKHEHASQVDAFRPITVLPVPYRVWATIRGRDLLRFLGSMVPGTLCGNVADRSACDMWYSIQSNVEMALVDDYSMVGAIMDICKAFNCLPRYPLLAIAKHLGVSDTILRPWQGMLDHLQRHFVIRQSYGPGVDSVTGFAEGCCLSVGSMLLVNLVMHSYMSLATPHIKTWSYVDNWEMTGSDPRMLQCAIEKMESFASLMDIQLDQNKSMVWAVTSSERSQLREGSIQVVRNIRDLGGHLQFSRQLTNSTLMKKCQALAPMWARLSRSFAPRKLKHRIIRNKAWPSALHACPGVHVSEAVLKDLRAPAMRSLGLSKPGANSMLYLSLVVHPCHDPEGYILVQCIRSLRRVLTPDIVGAYLASIVQVPHRKRVPGPIGVLTMRLELLGWMWVQDCIWEDQYGLPVDLFATPIQELMHRVLESFQQRVGQKISFRDGFEGMQNVDAVTSGKTLQKLGDVEGGLIKSLQVGTFITQDQTGRAHQVDSADWKCKFCGEADSLHHRHWQCTETRESREQMSESAKQWIQSQAPCVTQRAWFTMPDAIIHFRHALSEVPDTTNRFEVHTHEADRLYVFTDGSGLHPTEAPVRLVAWAWVLASAVGETDFRIKASGGVPGMWQTILRAEICAVVSALKYAIAVNKAITIFSDNDVVVKRLNRIRQGWYPHGLQSDGDLWGVVVHLCRKLEFRFQCVHVHSHQNSRLLSPEEEWVCSGNSAADVAAEDAFQHFPPALLKTHATAVTAYHTAVQSYHEMIHHFVRVGMKSLQVVTVHAPPKEQPVSEPCAFAEVHPQQIVESIRERVPQYMQFEQLSEWMSWFAALEAPSEAVRLVSWIELMFHFQATTGFIGMFCDKGTIGNRREWRSVASTAIPDMAKQAKNFAQFGWNMLRLWDPQWRVIQSKPQSPLIQYWVSCVPIRVGSNFDRVVCDHFRASGMGSISSARSLAKMPAATPA